MSGEYADQTPEVDLGRTQILFRQPTGLKTF
ncbi:hypothetical protein F4556_003894 [Kitasatospora gansuensis]|uniref:Uncharacterized protein n=1 Tax=Kitasatospora gansuensis TaxID=258050 RepID=A0A7W7WJ88_9ACTN|nr:hypothetical protein [Kitasatospora gansuensis]